MLPHRDAMSEIDRRKVEREFDEAVNMTAREIEAWLKTAESKKVGFKHERKAESVGHASGRRIIAILGKKRTDLTDEDLAHMRKVVGFVKRHLAQEPANIATSRWRYSLMNWGHDPLK